MKQNKQHPLHWIITLDLFNACGDGETLLSNIVFMKTDNYVYLSVLMRANFTHCTGKPLPLMVKIRTSLKERRNEGFLRSLFRTVATGYALKVVL